MSSRRHARARTPRRGSERSGGDAGGRAGLGDVITASVKEAIPGGTVKKKAVVQAVIVRQRKAYRRKDGSFFWCLQSVSAIRNEREEITHFVSVIVLNSAPPR